MSMTSLRTELLRTLEELSALAPDVRLGQLVANLSYFAKGPTHEAIWDVQDEELLAAAKRQLRDLAQHQAHVA
jgi:hypothetical protein